MRSGRPRRRFRWTALVLLVAAVALVRRGSSEVPVGDSWPPVPRAPGPSKA